MHYQNVQTAIEEAMEDLINTGGFQKHSPAICRDKLGYYYGSKLHGDEVVFDLSSGAFGYWTPEAMEEIPVCASGLAASINETIPAPNQRLTGKAV